MVDEERQEAEAAALMGTYDAGYTDDAGREMYRCEECGSHFGYEPYTDRECRRLCRQCALADNAVAGVGWEG